MKQHVAVYLVKDVSFITEADGVWHSLQNPNVERYFKQFLSILRPDTLDG